MLIFAVKNPQKLLYSGKNGQKVAETHSENEESSTFVVAFVFCIFLRTIYESTQ